jgi:hypothetical protein
MVKEEVNIGENCFLLIKQIGENSQPPVVVVLVMLEGFIQLLVMFFENAMCL